MVIEPSKVYHCNLKMFDHIKTFLYNFFLQILPSSAFAYSFLTLMIIIIWLVKSAFVFCTHFAFAVWAWMAANVREAAASWCYSVVRLDTIFHSKIIVCWVQKCSDSNFQKPLLMQLSAYLAASYNYNTNRFTISYYCQGVWYSFFSFLPDLNSTLY